MSGRVNFRARGKQAIDARDGSATIKPSGQAMPTTDDTDPKLTFPRLEVRVRQTDADAYWLHVWLWEKAGEERRELLNGTRADSLDEAHEIIRECAQRHGVEPAEADDITVEQSPDSN